MYTDPFGQADCESELEELGDGYRNIYFGNTPFNVAALNSKAYLIVGRRGAGKTALSHYFSFQRQVRNALVIDVDEPREYQNVLTQIASRTLVTPDLAVSNARDIWIYLIWCLVFQNRRESAKSIADACVPCIELANYTHAGFLNKAIDWLLGHFNVGTLGSDNKQLTDFLDDKTFQEAKAAVLQSSTKNPVFVAIDTLEKYDINDTGLMNAIAGLVEAAADFNLKYSKHGLHIKAFISGEIFPHLMEVALQNPLKSVKHPVHMLWRAKDLLRLIAWRYHTFLRRNGLLLPESVTEINWDNPKDVLIKAWIPYFGKDVRNRRGRLEHSFSYVLRHTQMRPRQLIELCNCIAAGSITSGNFPRMSSQDITVGVADGEDKLATEIVNSYQLIYPGVENIVQALSRLPIVFPGSELDRRAPESASHWRSGGYSPSAFSRLVIELGIVGKVASRSEFGHVNAEFEYAQRSALRISHRDECALHPMFFSKLTPTTAPDRGLTVMPFIVQKDEEDWINGFSDEQ
jgi:hypothetical protein